MSKCPLLHFGRRGRPSLVIDAAISTPQNGQHETLPRKTKLMDAMVKKTTPRAPVTKKDYWQMAVEKLQEEDASVTEQIAAVPRAAAAVGTTKPYQEEGITPTDLTMTTGHYWAYRCSSCEGRPTSHTHFFYYPERRGPAPIETITLPIAKPDCDREGCTANRPHTHWMFDREYLEIPRMEDMPPDEVEPDGSWDEDYDFPDVTRGSQHAACVPHCFVKDSA